MGDIERVINKLEKEEVRKEIIDAANERYDEGINIGNEIEIRKAIAKLEEEQNRRNREVYSQKDYSYNEPEEERAKVA